MLRLACAYAAAAHLAVPWAGVVLAAACLGQLRARRSTWGWLPAGVLAVVLGAMDRPRHDADLPADGVSLCATVWIDAQAVHHGERSSAWARVESWTLRDTTAARHAGSRLRGERVRLLARTRLPDYGGRCHVAGRLRAPRAPRNFGGFDEKSFLAARAAQAVVHAESVVMLDGARGAVWRRHASEPLRNAIRRRLQETLAPREAALLAALVLGLRADLDPTLSESWRALGMSHVLALSGLHVGLVAGALLYLVRSPRRRAGLIVLVGGVYAYAALGGLGPSVIRAAAMATWMACASHAGRARDPRTALQCAALLLVLDAPERARDLRFQLSCLATLGILVWLPVLARTFTHASRSRSAAVARRALAICAVGLAAQAATLPLVVTRFGMLSWAAPLANLTLVPVVGLALLLTLAGVPVQLISETLARSVWLAAGALVHGVLRLTDLAPERWDPRLFMPAHPGVGPLAWLCAGASISAGLCFATGRRGRAGCALAIAGIAACGLGVAATRVRAPEWEVVALDVGQGDALVARFDTHAWLLDAGNDRPRDAGAETIVPHLRRAGTQRLRGLLLTHPHRDHYGGAAAVLSAIAVDTVYVARASYDAAPYAALRAEVPGVPWRGLAAGDRLRLAPGYIADILWPPEQDVLGSGPNGVSLVLWARGAGKPDLLALGDLEEDGERALLDAHPRALAAHASGVAIVKVGHHGSDTSSTPELLDALDPEIALISVGVRNRYGHPGARTLSALRARRCVALRTDRGGAARVVLRGGTLWVERPSTRAYAVVIDNEAVAAGVPSAHRAPPLVR